MRRLQRLSIALAAVIVPVLSSAQDTPGRLTGSTISADSARDAAIAKLSDFLTRYPSSPLRPNALFQLGELLVRRADAAFAAAQRAAANGGDAPDRPDYAPAIARYEELVRQHRDFDRLDAAAYSLGTLYYGSQRYADAARMFELVTGTPNSSFRPEAYFRLGDSYFEMAARERGEPRRALFAQAATAYENATTSARRDGDIYFLSLYKLGWAYYSQASQANQDEYQKAVDVFGRLVTEYDRLTPEQQARLGLRGEAIEYMAVSFTQIGGAEAARRYFASRQEANPLRLQLLQRVAGSLRDQGEFGRAVEAYRAVVAEAPNDSGALAAQREIIDIYQNRMLEPELAQQARLELVNSFAPGTPWAEANPTQVQEAIQARETALRQSGQYALARAQRTNDRQRYAEAAELYGRYVREFGGQLAQAGPADSAGAPRDTTLARPDSAQAVNFLYGEALFGQGEYTRAGSEYSRAAYGYPNGDPRLSAQAGQNAIVAFDSALVRARTDSAAQDSLFAAIDRYVAAFPNTDIARRALIQKGRRASESQRWDVMAATFRTYAERFPNDAYTPTALKLVGDALYRRGEYSAAQAQWESAQATASQSGRRALADSINRQRTAAAASFADTLIKAGEYRRAAEEVYVAFADRNPSSERTPDALRNAVETYMLADSVARSRGDSSASRQARERAIELSERLVTQYPRYQYRVQYQSLRARLLADIGRRDDAVQAWRDLIRDNPTWPGRADAMVRLAVTLDSLGQERDAAGAYEQFAAAFPRDPRAADAQFNAAITYLDARDSTAAAAAYARFATAFPRDPRVPQAQQARVAILQAAGDSSTVNAELARLCVRPSEALRATCAARTAETAFRQGVALFPQYRSLKLTIATRGQLTRAGVERASARKRQLLRTMTGHFTRAIQTGVPEWLSAASYYVGLAQWEYGNFLRNVELPAGLTVAQREAAQGGAEQQAQEYDTASRTTWQTLVDKATQENFTNEWVDRARQALQGNVQVPEPTSFLPRVKGVQQVGIE
jgi:TolA-binding protein